MNITPLPLNHGGTKGTRISNYRGFKMVAQAVPIAENGRRVSVQILNSSGRYMTTVSGDWYGPALANAMLKIDEITLIEEL